MNSTTNSPSRRTCESRDMTKKSSFGYRHLFTGLIQQVDDQLDMFFFIHPIDIFCATVKDDNVSAFYSDFIS